MDQFMETLIEPWASVRSNWEEHARYLFRQYSTVYRILQEAQFSNDEGREASDSILVEIQKSNAAECGRRTLRLFQKSEGGNFEDDGPSHSATTEKASKNSNVSQGNPNKESVTECMSRRKFVEVVRVIHPTMPMKEVSYATF
ncbi:hypothetical protein EON65_08765 [archaeon]|nr:MAG: hypothetical protein EON65_08765 [archaeon]